MSMKRGTKNPFAIKQVNKEIEIKNEKEDQANNAADNDDSVQIICVLNGKDEDHELVFLDDEEDDDNEIKELLPSNQAAVNDKTNENLDLQEKSVVDDQVKNLPVECDNQELTVKTEKGTQTLLDDFSSDEEQSGSSIESCSDVSSNKLDKDFQNNDDNTCTIVNENVNNESNSNNTVNEKNSTSMLESDNNQARSSISATTQIQLYTSMNNRPPNFQDNFPQRPRCNYNRPGPYPSVNYNNFQQQRSNFNNQQNNFNNQQNNFNNQQNNFNNQQNSFINHEVNRRVQLYMRQYETRLHLGFLRFMNFVSQNSYSQNNSMRNFNDINRNGL